MQYVNNRLSVLKRARHLSWLMITHKSRPEDRGALESAFIREIIPADVLKNESHLSHSCWVEHAFLSPAERTQLFLREYIATYRLLWRKYQDMSTADEQAPLDPRLFWNPDGEIVSLWKARQTADELGIPYSVFLYSVMHWAVDQRKRKYFPRPNQLCSEAQLIAAVGDWERTESIRQVPGDNWDTRFFAPNPIRAGDPRWRAVKILESRLKRSRWPERSLANAMECRFLSAAEARELASRCIPDKPDVFDGALELLAAPPLPVSDGDLEVRPACIGLCNLSPACESCPAFVACNQDRARADERLLSRTGSTDPVADRKRAQDRERQRRRRRRKKEAAQLQSA